MITTTPQLLKLCQITVSKGTFSLTPNLTFSVLFCYSLPVNCKTNKKKINKNADIRVTVFWGFFLVISSFIHRTPICVVQCTSGVPFLKVSAQETLTLSHNENSCIWKCASVIPGTQEEHPIDTGK